MHVLKWVLRDIRLYDTCVVMVPSLTCLWIIQSSWHIYAFWSFMHIKFAFWFSFYIGLWFYKSNIDKNIIRVIKIANDCNCHRYMIPIYIYYQWGVLETSRNYFETQSSSKTCSGVTSIMWIANHYFEFSYKLWHHYFINMHLYMYGTKDIPESFNPQTKLW